MHRIDNSAAVPTPPTPSPVGNPGYFFRGDPRTGRIATLVDDDWFNAVQEEIAHVIEFAGLTLDKPRWDQLRLAIQQLVQNGLPPMPFLPLLGGTMQGQINQPLAPTADQHLANKLYVDQRDNAVWAHADELHNAAVSYANARAIQEGDRAQNNAWAWDQSLWDAINLINATQGGMAAYGSSGMFTVPSVARTIEVWATGAGGGGGGNHLALHSGGGGGAGGTAYGSFAVFPGQQYWVTVGAGGGGGSAGNSGGPGASSQFGSLLGASGGEGGAGSGAPSPAGGQGGLGYGSGLAMWGGDGGDGWDYNFNNNGGLGGNGGPSFWGGGGRAGSEFGYGGKAWGSGGGASYHRTGGGGSGQAGIVVVRWNR